MGSAAGELIEGPLRTLQPLEVIAVEPRTTQAKAFVCHLAQHHYLGLEGRGPEPALLGSGLFMDATWPACSLALRPGKQKLVIVSSAGALSSANSDSR